MKKYKKDVYVVVDVESNGPLQGVHSMISFAAVAVLKNGEEYDLSKTFKGFVSPISENYDPEALAISNVTFDETKKYPSPDVTMRKFVSWCEEISKNGENRLVLISDNNGYDAPWINYYTLRFVGKNPFGWTSRRIGDLFCGVYGDLKFKWKKFRKTNHDHDPLNDAMGNAEALVYLFQNKKFSF